MKKFASVAFVTILSFYACVPMFAQKGRFLAPSPAKVKPVVYEKIGAYTEGSGVLLRWETRSETGVVGFNVYRSNRRGSEMISQSAILSTASRSSSEPENGGQYQYFDPNGRIGSNYYLEVLASDGRRVRSEPVTAQYDEKFEANFGISTNTLRTAALSNNKDIESKTPELSSDLKNEVQSNLMAPDLVTHRWVVSQPGAKISVKKAGFYRVSRDSLQSAGFNLNSDSTKWRLFLQGVEQAIIVGANDQYIEFYGQGIDTVESDTSVYYLLADTVGGKRITNKMLRSFGGNVTAANYKATAEKKERTSFVDTVINGPLENYWGHLVTSDIGLNTRTFNVTGIDFQSPNTVVTLKMQSFTYSTLVHQATLSINGNVVGMMTIGAGFANKSTDFTVPTSYLQEGNNLIDIYTPTSSDYSLFDSISIKYNRKYTADQNQVAFTSPDSRRFDVGGFSTPNIRVFDLTYDSNIQQVVNLPIVQANGGYSVKFPANRQSVLYAVEDSALLQPASVTFNNPSTLSTAANAANAVIISYSAPDFLAAAETWANYRRSVPGGGFNVKVIDVADIYDEYSYGSQSSDAVKNFLDYASHNWQTQPHYVLLLGDGSYDPRNYQGAGAWNLVPPKNVDGLLHEMASDDALVDFNNDGVADLSIGRIPARSAADITNALNKTMTFETPAMLSLSRGAVFAHDVTFPGGYDFLSMSQQLRTQLPVGIPSMYIDRGSDAAETAQSHAILMNEINSGRFIINYSGHGATGVWDSSQFFGPNSPLEMTNANMPTIFTMMTCWNGYFIRPEFDSIAEVLIRSTNGGAAATWASTTETTPDYQMAMATRFYNQINVGTMNRIGDVIKDAKTTIPGSDVAYSWVLLGDPMLKVK